MSDPVQRRRDRIRNVGLPAVLFLIIFTLSAVPLVRDFQLRLGDTFFRLVPRPQAQSQVVLVLIDDEALNAYGRWPWSREVLARLTRTLSNAGAQVIGLDILLSEPQSAPADNALAQALGASRSVIVDKIGAYPDGPRWIEPLPQFARKAAVGHALAVLDFDGVCRRFPARELTTDGSRWAFAAELARRADPRATKAFLAEYDVPFKDDSAVMSTAKPVLVPIAFRRDRFDRISAKTVLEGGNIAAVRGRPVLVGFGPAEISDRLITPLSGDLPMAGVEVHAQILDSILTGRALREAPPWLSGILLLCGCVAVIFALRRWHGAAAVGVLVGIGVVVYVGAFLALWWASQILPVGPMMLALVVGPILAYIVDFFVIERSVTRQLRELQNWLTMRRNFEGTGGKDLSWRLELLRDLQCELGALYELHMTLLETTQSLTAIFDEHGNVLLNNQRFAEACRLDQREFTINELRLRFVPKEDAPLVATPWGEEGEAYVDGSLYSVRIMALPPTTLTPRGGTVVTLTSLSTRVERDRARAEALGFVTHELRTPLVAIQGFAELMMHYPGSRSYEKAPETIYRESKRLLALINSYLDVLRLDAGARPVRSEDVSLEEAVREAFEILQPLAAAVNMRLVFSEKDLPPVTGDAPLIGGAILNLVSNAIKYGKQGTEVRVACERVENEMVISVHNQGEPIAQESLARLFEAFYRASDAEEARPGWGLGLAFVKRIAEKHGGCVRARSEADGTSFEIHLPLATGKAAVRGVA